MTEIRKRYVDAQNRLFIDLIKDGVLKARIIQHGVTYSPHYRNLAFTGIEEQWVLSEEGWAKRAFINGEETFCLAGNPPEPIPMIHNTGKGFWNLDFNAWDDVEESR